MLEALLVQWARGPDHPLKIRLQDKVWRFLGQRERLLTVPYIEGTHLRVDPTSHIGRHVLYDGSYERPIYEAIAASLPATGVFVDIGCHIGCFAVPAATRCARVIAIDPHPKMARITRETARSNRLHNVDVHQVAITDRDGEADLFVSWDDQMSSLSAVWAGTGPTASRVRTVTLAHLLDEARIARVDVLKIDAEGESSRILSGAEPVLDRIDTIIFEQDDEDSPLRGADLLRRHGFVVKPLPGGDLDNFIARRPGASGSRPDSQVRQRGQA